MCATRAVLLVLLIELHRLLPWLFGVQGEVTAIAFVTGFAKGLIIMIFGVIFECEACEV